MLSSALDLENAVVLEPTPTLELTTLPTAQPFPTLDLENAVVLEPTPTLELTTLPTAQPFPTLDLSTAVAPTTAPTIAPLSLPALATMDDGASDWLASPNWSLQAQDSGLAWVMTSTSSELLRWQTPIDLRSATSPVALTFQSWLVGDGLASVQVSTDGLIWQSVAVVPTSDTWISVSVDMNGYIGNIIQIAFLWVESDPQTPDQWMVDTVLVAEETETIVPTIGGILPTDTPTATPQPTETATEVIQPTDMSTLEPQLTETPFQQEETAEAGS